MTSAGPTVAETTAKPYKDTLILPQTDFKMKAGAAQREPELLTFWAEHGVYAQAQANRTGAGWFTLHDGPPYLSSDKIHIGTALNKVLKDIVTRYKYQRGFKSPYVPGYDGHGLPIENAVVKTIKGGRHAISEGDLRAQCRAFGLKNLAAQTEQFQRLGVWGNWDKPYVTTDARFEAVQIRLFWEMFEKGYVYKGLKPVYWSPVSETALAEAEVEYADHTSHSIYVAYPFAGKHNARTTSDPAWLDILQDARFVIWTTTPWTLPASLALSVHPELPYALVDVPNHGKLVVAEGLLEAFITAIGVETNSVTRCEWAPEVWTVSGSALELLQAQHPFLDTRQVPILCGTHVTLDAGTGIVHTAPGHGMEDYTVCQTYDREALADCPIGILSPLNNKGCYTTEVGVPEWEGQFYEKANPLIIEHLQARQALLHASTFVHSYPHDWRSHTPVIYRATEQWFINVNAFRDQALGQINEVSWIPERGKSRIESMVANRTDWCISRQRVWGVPIPMLYDTTTGEQVMTRTVIDHLERLFTEHTSDIWWSWSVEQLLEGLPADEKAKLGLPVRALRRETDIMDVWFDSGVTHTAVVHERADELGPLPVSLYLEGSDQHRGWFQSSLLTSVMLHGTAPYQSVLTHGFVMDGQGRKMSKSLGNVVDPASIISQYGADVLRLWVASVDYTVDVRIGNTIVAQLVEVYKKIRNTLRYLLGSLHDFNPATDSVPYAQLSPLDQALLAKLNGVVSELTTAFEGYQFYQFSQVLQNFCGVDLSSLYFDVAKDSLYCDAVNAPRRRAFQTVLYHIYTTLLPMLVPIMPFLAEDAWQATPETLRPRFGFNMPPVSITLAPWPLPVADWDTIKGTAALEAVVGLREQVYPVLESLRKAGTIAANLEASVQLSGNWQQLAGLDGMTADFLSHVLITSEVTVTNTAETAMQVAAERSAHAKCERCWRYEASVGKAVNHPTLCERCADVVG